jgi:hypothetical protein
MPACTAARTTIFRRARWLTGHIGVHHVHHLSSRVPFYRLPEVLRDHPELRGVGRLTLVDSLRCARLVLWDEDRRQLVTFRHIRWRLRQARPNLGRLPRLRAASLRSPRRCRCCRCGSISALRRPASCGAKVESVAAERLGR